jgi:rare lipoprotein A (peptidoglycan hydrolase)
MTTKAIIQSLLIIAILIPTATPAPALAAQQSILPLPTLPQTPTLSARDPYLAAAIEGLPNYSYQQTGAMLAVASPLTTEGKWPKAKAKVRVQVQPSAQPLLIPTGDAAVVLEGEASYYSRAGCLGCDPAMIMANGQSLDDNALTMAIGANLKHLVGHQAKVTSLATGKSVTVRITDTGGFYQAKYGHRVADLTIATKNAIGMAGGVGQVRVEVF